MVGSGAVVIKYWNSGTSAFVSLDNLTDSQAQPYTEYLHFEHGPNISDSTKWRFNLQAGVSGSNNPRVLVRVWLVATAS